MKKFFLLCCICCSMIALAQNAGFKLPAYEKMVLKNGLTIYLMEQHEVPMINVSAIVPAGAIYDETKSGIASLTASALMHGTRSKTKAQLEEALDFIGASINTYAAKEFAGLNAEFASKDRNQVLEMVQEVLLSPRFDTTEFRKQQQRVLVQLEQAKESPRQVIGNYFEQMLYAGHVYANPVSGRKPSVTAIAPADVQRFYQQHYGPTGAAISVVGDFNAKEMKVTLNKLFGGWAKTSGQQQAVGQVNAKPGAARVLLVNKDDARETTFFIGGPGVSRSNPDMVAIEVVNTILGGRFTSWLNDELRVNSGLTYGASSGFSPLKHAGTFQISTFTATKNTEAAIDKALEVLNRLHTKGIDEQTLTSAKNYVKGQFPPKFETSYQLASLLTQMFWYGFDESYINNFQKNVEGLTVEKAKQIVAQYFPKDKLQFVLVGKASDIKELAKKWGTVTEVNIKEDAVKTF